MLGISAAQLALQNEKGSRADRDRQIAQMAAESALLDAEIDIESTLNLLATPVERKDVLSENSDAFKLPDAEICGKGEADPFMGLCKSSQVTAHPNWLKVDFTNDSATTAYSVPYGKFTGRTMQVAVGGVPSGNLPAKLPRYIIEKWIYKGLGNKADGVNVADKPLYIFRITAMGFGARESTKVVLQSFYRHFD